MMDKASPAGSGSIGGSKRGRSESFDKEEHEEEDECVQLQLCGGAFAEATARHVFSLPQKLRKGETEVREISLNPLQAHDTIVVALSFLADAEDPSDLLDISTSSKSFRTAALDSIIWKDVCDRKWKTKFGHSFRMERAKKDAENKGKGGDGPNSDFDLSVSSTPSLRPYPYAHPSAAGTSEFCSNAGFWYHRYWNELKMSTVGRITLGDLRK